MEVKERGRDKEKVEREREQNVRETERDSENLSKNLANILYTKQYLIFFCQKKKKKKHLYMMVTNHKIHSTVCPRSLDQIYIMYHENGSRLPGQEVRGYWTENNIFATG